MSCVFDGSNWSYVGPQYLVDAFIEPSLAFHPISGLPHVLFHDDDNGSHASVLVFSPDLAQEILISGNSTEITSGDNTPQTGDHTAFGNTTSCVGSIVRTFTIENHGTANLSLTGSPLVTLSGNDVSMFSITSLPSGSTLSPCSSSTFEITYQPTLAGDTLCNSNNTQ